MPDQIVAVVDDGKFVPETPCQLPNGTRVVLTVNQTGFTAPQITDPEARRAHMRQLVEWMNDHPFPPDAPKLTRDELHERR